VIEDPKFSPDVERKFVVADMITGYGVAESVRHYYSTYHNKDLKGKKVIVQGWGNVGAAGAYYLAKEGAKIVGIIDRVGGLINKDGFSFEEIKDLFLKKDGNKLVADNMMSFDEVNEKIWSVPADIFIPCAASRLITRDQIDQMIENGMEVISSGANVPFADSEIFFGPIADYTDKQISVIPDFISNCGMARVFGYLMQDDVAMTDEAIFSDTSVTIEKAIKAAHTTSSDTKNIAKTAFEIALKKLV
jgi:glutamate dehydrogenase/leucine dehydrogenase